ncbi:thiamine pyrophosphate-binding protein [Plantactinospora sp. KBS50]|uniref:thiamine pyrophosphate-binding protein n=1 Tax=Plantactinospora sp. KBS50 TaxID=2024580 RepID=UPI000BAA9BD7|nr:thiamine pyrophosphate-binding protein [Plantactinospora sp. KBS50]ASW54441.1 thiamine pyrophosphate-binding protein [Plantactinospora sp. KBS50]
MSKGMTGGELIARMLAAEGVEDLFGIIDGTYFGLYRALAGAGITLHSPRHEAAAAHMAGAYARLTGRLGVVMASNGPGVANVLPGVAVEEGEGNRVLLITSARRVGVGHPDRGGAYQYFDQSAVIGPMSKWSGYVPSADRIPELLRRALRICFTGRPGVVHLDVPEDLINGPTGLGPDAVRPPHTYRRVAPLQPDPVLVDRAAQLLAAAAQPVIHAGSGVYHAGAEAELARLADLLAAPVTTSWAARGALPESRREAIPMTALDLNDKVRSAADVVLVVGSRLGETDWWGKAPNWGPPGRQRTIQIDVDEERVGVNKPVEIALVADAREALRALADAVAALDVPNRAERLDRLDGWQAARAEVRAKLDKPLAPAASAAPVHPGSVAAVAQEIMPEDTVWVFDGGNTVVWANFYHEARVPRSILSTFKFGMLGAGLGQALGAAAAAPDRRVCCLIGDGAFGMHASEIESAVRLDLPIVFVVFVDGQWGMVKMSQQIAAAPLATVVRKVVWNASLPDDQVVYADFEACRYDQLATALGAHGEYVTSATDLRAALERARDCGGPAVVHVQVDNVGHMWAPGLRAFKKMHQEPKG